MASQERIRNFGWHAAAPYRRAPERQRKRERGKERRKERAKGRMRMRNSERKRGKEREKEEKREGKKEQRAECECETARGREAKSTGARAPEIETNGKGAKERGHRACKRASAHERVLSWVCVRTCPRAASHSTAHVLVCTCRFWGLRAITLSVTCSTLLWSTFRVAPRVYNLHPHSRHSHGPYRRRVHWPTPPSCRTASSLDPCLECWNTG